MNRRLKIAIPVIAGVLTITSGIGVAAVAGAVDRNTVNRPAVSYDYEGPQDGAAYPGYCGGYGAMRGFGAGFGVTQQVADLLGTTVADLQAQLAEGKTLADIAAAQGVSQEQLIETMLAPHQERMAVMVQNGTLTQEEADNLTLQARERSQAVITGQVEGYPGWCQANGTTGGYGGGMMYGWNNRQQAPQTDAAPRRGYGGMMGGFGRGMMRW